MACFYLTVHTYMWGREHVFLCVYAYVHMNSCIFKCIYVSRIYVFAYVCMFSMIQ